MKKKEPLYVILHSDMKAYLNQHTSKQQILRKQSIIVVKQIVLFEISNEIEPKKNESQVNS